MKAVVSKMVKMRPVEEFNRDFLSFQEFKDFSKEFTEDMSVDLEVGNGILSIYAFSDSYNVSLSYSKHQGTYCLHRQPPHSVTKISENLLFVTESMMLAAVEHFFEFGECNPNLLWTDLDNIDTETRASAVDTDTIILSVRNDLDTVN